MPPISILEQADGLNLPFGVELH